MKYFTILLLLFMFGVYNSDCTTCVASPNRTLLGHGSQVVSVAWSPDGTMIASGDEDYYMVVHDVITGNILHNLLDWNNDDYIISVSWFPDSKSVIGVNEEETVNILEIATGAVRVIEGPSDDWYDGEVSPDGTEIAVGGHDYELYVYKVADILTGSTTHQVKLKFHDEIDSIAYSPDSTKIATALGPTLSINSRSATDPVVWQTTSFANTDQHTSDIESIDWSSDGRLIVSGAQDNNVKVWDIATGTARTFIGHTDQVLSVKFSPDDSTVASGSKDDTIRIWDVATGSSYVLDTLDSDVNAVDWSPDCCSIVSGDDDDKVMIFSVLDGCRTKTATATASATPTPTGTANPTVTAPSTVTATSSLSPNISCTTNAFMAATNQTTLPICEREANSVPAGGVQVGSVISVDNMRAVLQELYGLPTELSHTFISSLSSHQRAIMGQMISEIKTAMYDQQDQVVGMLDNRSPGSTFDMPTPTTEAGQATAISLSLGTADFAVVTAHVPNQTSLASLGADSINESGLHTFLFSVDRFDAAGAGVTEESLRFTITAPTAALNVYSLRSNETTWVNILTEGGRIIDLQDGTVQITVPHTSTFTGFQSEVQVQDDSDWWLVLAIGLPIVALVLVVATTWWFVSSKKKKDADADAIAAAGAALDYKLEPYSDAYQQAYPQEAYPYVSDLTYLADTPPVFSTPSTMETPRWSSSPAPPAPTVASY